MFEDYIERENKIFGVLQAFIGAGLDFVVIGGYAISAYKHRFSVDADVVMKVEDKSRFEEVLKKEGLAKTTEKDLNHVYASEFIRYELKSKLPVSINLLIGGVGSRVTGASFSFEQLNKHAEKKKIMGTEKEVTVKVPQREVLIVLKLHAGRLTDFRDIAAITKNINLEIIKSMIWQGNKNIIKKNIKTVVSLVDKKEFIDSFKGIFMEKKYDTDVKEIKKLRKLLI